MSKILTIGWFYPDYLNLYGDRGNIEILFQRAKRRGFSVKVLEISLDTVLSEELMSSIDFVFMGGGPDLAQQKIYKDFLENKGYYLISYLDKEGVGLFICGSYQLLGKFYKAADGSILKGLSFLDFYTEASESRSIGNVVVHLNEALLNDPYFVNNNYLGDTLVGFENHAGMTFLDSSLTPLGTTKKSFGNNLSDITEGLWYKNTIGSYLHGPILARNPHLADYLISKSLDVPQLMQLDDSLIISAHAQSKELAR